MFDRDKESEETDDIFANKLKQISISVLEQTIAKAVGDLVGINFKCHISSINYDNGFSIQGAKFDVSLSQPREERFGRHSVSRDESSSIGSENDLP
ncbi:MAG TPA: hypothetical protein VGB02_07405 [Pyrinomonadaceae bacterium]|jgi:hypothetical protein